MRVGNNTPTGMYEMLRQANKVLLSNTPSATPKVDKVQQSPPGNSATIGTKINTTA